MIRGAAAGDARSREVFALRYEPIVRQYFQGKWRTGRHRNYIDDAVQDVFVACYKDHGALQRADPEWGGFRSFLAGVCINVSRRIEERQLQRRGWQTSPTASELENCASDEATASAYFDQAWALMIVRETRQRLKESANNNPDAERRVEVLRLYFDDKLPIQEIALILGETPKQISRDKEKVLVEFHKLLRKVVEIHLPGTPGEVERECRALMECLARIANPRGNRPASD
ncbi:MAG: sigma-70 family RNA polymerase sigma factor [Planctomycetota bacterium]|nr:sigma-70 family RNA polymerase sigma factor [Planctomycetota bacterium]